jgi:alpha-mannosidase
MIKLKVSGNKAKKITTKGIKPKITVLENTSLRAKIELKFDMMLPQEYDFISNDRSVDLKLNQWSMTFIICKSDEMANIEFDIDNFSKDHRVRAVINPSSGTDLTNATSPFDVIHRNRKTAIDDFKSGDRPNSGLVNCDNLAIYNIGLFEYEHFIDRNLLAFTLVRSTGWIIQNMGNDGYHKTPENQCIRKINHSIALYIHCNEEITKLVNKEIYYKNPMLAYFSAVDRNKFMGGRPGVQDSDIGEIFYREDFSSTILPHQENAFKINNAVVSSFKKSEDNNGYIVRTYNPTENSIIVDVDWNGSIKQCNMQEIEINEFSSMLKPKEIKTIYIRKE